MQTFLVKILLVPLYFFAVLTVIDRLIIWNNLLTVHCVCESGCQVSATGGHDCPGMHGAKSWDTERTHRQ